MRANPRIRRSNPFLSTTRPIPRTYRGSPDAGWAGTGWSSATPLKTTSPVSGGSPNRAASSNVKLEQPVTADAWRKPARSAARSVCDRSKMSASSMTVSPWRLTIRGIPSQRDSAVAYTPLGPKHCTCSTSGRNASAAARSSTSVRRPSDTTGAQIPAGLRAAAWETGVRRSRPVSWPPSVSDWSRCEVQTSTSSPASRSVSARCRDSSSTPPTLGGYALGSRATRVTCVRLSVGGSVPSMLCSSEWRGLRPRMICRVLGRRWLRVLATSCRRPYASSSVVRPTGRRPGPR